MDLLTTLLIGIGLSMDCFAVSLAVGTTAKTRLLYAAAVIALCFGSFQAGMTVIGWLAGISLIGLISAYDHWIAFILLAVVGGKMMGEGVLGDEDEGRIGTIRFIPVVILSFATSIDALGVGVGFGVLRTAVPVPALIIGIVCAAISFAGVMAGEKLGDLLGRKIEIAGGLLLIMMGIRILAEHLLV